MTDVNKPDDQPPAELEPLATVEDELRRLTHHPRQEAARLHDVAEAGESGATPFIELATVAMYVVPFVLIMIGLTLGIYFAVR